MLRKKEIMREMEGSKGEKFSKGRKRNVKK